MAAEENHQSKWSLAAKLSLVATSLTIFTFVTGYNSLDQMLPSSNNQASLPEQEPRIERPTVDPPKEKNVEQIPWSGPPARISSQAKTKVESKLNPTFVAGAFALSIENGVTIESQLGGYFQQQGLQQRVFLKSDLIHLRNHRFSKTSSNRIPRYLITGTQDTMTETNQFNGLTTNTKLVLQILDLEKESVVHSMTLTANGFGFDESAAVALAEERLMLELSKKNILLE